MGWGDWKVPELTVEVEFRLKVQELMVRRTFRRDPEAVLHQALLLAREEAILQRTVEKAHRRIMELEVAAALIPAGKRPWWCWWCWWC